ncbi:MAG TPA: TatD family hydrolase, partial [Candidatus Gracilibacteria bacterium]|nr:TatD family hydrolase [Candidatus Gracilibacteria bacterium]
MFTDTHSHIHFAKEFPDVEDLIVRAEEGGVMNQIIVGCTVKDSLQALEFVKARTGKRFWSTLGVHPHNADQLTDAILADFERLVGEEEKVVALGEMGLDYFRDFQPHDLQQETFRRQLELAKKLDVPVVVHVRDAWEDAMKILGGVGNSKVILHCFTGTIEYARECWERGYHTSFSGVVTYPKNEYLREAAAEAPAELLLIETDCPYLTPQSRRGQRNEPAFVVETAKCLADQRGLTTEEAAKLTTENALKLFG